MQAAMPGRNGKSGIVTNEADNVTVVPGIYEIGHQVHTRNIQKELREMLKREARNFFTGVKSD